MNNRESGRADYIAPVMVVVVMAMALLLLSCSHTREAAKYEPPTAEKILDRYVERSGGIANYDKITNRYMEGTLDIPAAGLSLQTQIYSAKPNLIYTVAQADAVGEIRRGTDGKVFWENSLMSGPRLLEGAELTEALREAAFDRLAYWRKYYAQAEYIGVDSVDGTPVSKVVVTPEEGQPETLYFDQGNGLLIKVESIITHQMGDIPVEVFLQDYREVDGIKMPFISRVKVMGQDRTMTTTAVRQNIDMPDTLFAVPDEIRELLDDQ
jgi:zinc protease